MRDVWIFLTEQKSRIKSNFVSDVDQYDVFDKNIVHMLAWIP